MAGVFDVKEKDLPTIRLVKAINEEEIYKYKYPGVVTELTAQSMAAFLSDFRNGKI